MIEKELGVGSWELGVGRTENLKTQDYSDHLNQDVASQQIPNPKSQILTTDSQLAGFEDIISRMIKAGEKLVASWAEGLRVSVFDVEKLTIEIVKPVDFTLVSQREFSEKIKQLTGQDWHIIYVDENEAKSEPHSVNQKKILDIENRKKSAINSPVIQNILKEFQGAEIISVAL